MLPRADVIPLAMSATMLWKYVISMGVVAPGLRRGAPLLLRNPTAERARRSALTHAPAAPWARLKRRRTKNPSEAMRTTYAA